MGTPIRISAAVVCSKGCVRGNNEDNFYFNGDLMELDEMDCGAVIAETFTGDGQFYAIADGMGGGDNGERASALAVKMMVTEHEALLAGDARQLLEAYAHRINDAIYRDGQANHSNTEGSTLAALFFKNGTAYVANVGDSRVYLQRGNELRQLSMDHSTVADMMRAGRMTAEQARKSPLNNMITRFLGMSPEDVPGELAYQSAEPVKPGSRFMLCSDGVCDLLSNVRLQNLLSMNADAKTVATAIVNKSLEEGGKDNSTCIVLDVQ